MTHNNELPEKRAKFGRLIGKAIAGLLGSAVLVVALLFIVSEYKPYALPYELQTEIRRIKLLPKALDGDIYSQMALASTYSPLLDNKHKSDRKRFYWFKEAARNGDEYAAYLTGRALERGYGVTQDRSAALIWYAVASSKGDDWSRIRFDYRSHSTSQDDVLIEASLTVLNNRQSMALSDANPGAGFRDCPECPEMVLIPGVNGKGPFGVSKFEITVADYAACLRENFCWYGRADRPFPYDTKSLDPNLPILDLNLSETRDYLKWLSQKTGTLYRLPSRQEWIWAARGGTDTRYPWGNSPDLDCQYANLSLAGQMARNSMTPSCRNRASGLATVGSYAPNGYGLHDMVGNLSEITAMCPMVDCDPQVLLGGNYLTAEPNLDGPTADNMETPLRGDLDGIPVTGLRIVRDFDKYSRKWGFLESTINSAEDVARITYYTENDSPGDGNLLWLEWLREEQPEFFEALANEISTSLSE